MPFACIQTTFMHTIYKCMRIHTYVYIPRCSATNAASLPQGGDGRRIVGGTKATEPAYVVLIQKVGGASITCTGELIAPRYQQCRQYAPTYRTFHSLLLFYCFFWRFFVCTFRE